MLSPLVALVVLIVLGSLFGGLISKPLPWFLRRLFVGIFALTGAVLWAWLTFYVHMFPAI